MKSVIELIYGDTVRNYPKFAPDSEYSRMFNIKREHMRMLSESMTKEQKEWLDAYSEANGKTEEIMQTENMRYAFYLGAQLMAEMLEYKEKMEK